MLSFVVLGAQILTGLLWGVCIMKKINFLDLVIRSDNKMSAKLKDLVHCLAYDRLNLFRDNNI